MPLPASANRIWNITTADQKWGWICKDLNYSQMSIKYDQKKANVEFQKFYEDCNALTIVQHLISSVFPGCHKYFYCRVLLKSTLKELEVMVGSGF